MEQKKQAEKLAESESTQAKLAKRQNAVYMKEITKLKNEKQIVELQVQEYRNANQGQALPTTSDISETSLQMKQIQETVTHLKEEKEEIAKRLAILQKKHDEMLKNPSVIENPKIVKEAQELHARFKDQQQKMQELQSAMSASEADNITFKKENQELKQTLQQTQDTHSKEMTLLVQQLQILERDNGELKYTMQSQLQAFEQETSKFAVQMNETGKQLAEREKELSTFSERAKMDVEKLKKLRALRKSMQTLRASHKQTKTETADKLKAFTKQFKDLYDMGISKLVQAVQEVSDKYKKEAKLRKDLFNEIQDLKGNIRVYVRARPYLDNEQKLNSLECAPDEIKVNDTTNKKNYTFDFERVFGWTSTQSDIFSHVKPLATSILDGYNVCIFAYGQTGSGKTHTMVSICRIH